MALRKECPPEIQLNGLRLKRRVGEKVFAKCLKSGEILAIQVTATWDGHQVTLAFEGDGFHIQRGELRDDLD
jgi:hypothetical protein